jgi:hypothetical protein
MMIAEETRVHEARCESHLARLRMVACEDNFAAFPDLAAVEVRMATSAILAEVEAIAPDLWPTVTGTAPAWGTGPFLGVRRDRLVMAAEEAVSAALKGNTSDLRGHVRRFDSLVSAIWVVQRALQDSGRGTAALRGA